jgi:alpha-tubulin suppressor-like RCC1 family protein
VTEEGGGLLTLGDNSCGQLGRESVEACDGTPLEVDVSILNADRGDEDGSDGEPEDGGVRGGRGGLGGEGVKGGRSWRDLSCGDQHAIAARTDGSVLVWGRGTQVDAN